MKFDKNTIVVVVLCIIFVLGWTPFCKYMGWISDEPRSVVAEKTEEQSPTATKKIPVASVEKPDAVAKTESKTVAAKNSKLDPKKFQAVTIQNDEVIYTISPYHGLVKDVELKKFKKSDKEKLVSFSDLVLPGAFSATDHSVTDVASVTSNLISPDSFQVTRALTQNNQTYQMTQTWELADSYQVKYNIKIRSLSKTPILFKEFKVMTCAMQPLQFLTGDTPRSETFNVDYYTKKFKSIDASDDDDEDFYLNVSVPAKWVGVSNKYFTCLLKPENAFSGGVKPFRKKCSEKVKKADVDYFSAAVAGVFKDFSLSAGESKEFNFTIYTGPKELGLLEKFDESAQQIMHLSMFAPMEWISRQLLLFLVWLKSICGSWGWSIIILTIIVRMAFWPITQKANASMKKMQKLQPLVKELREKYKNDQQTLNVKTMELYKIHKVNPLGGCLPILLQIPVFIALYSTIDSSVELRHTSFMWAHDLAQPDTVAVIMWGLPINPLVIMMTLLMLVQQKLTPAAADPTQQKIMLMMPLIMLFVLYSLPSGLTLYWTVSQVISILQLLINKKFNKDDTANTAETAKTS